SSASGLRTPARTSRIDARRVLHPRSPSWGLRAKLARWSSTPAEQIVDLGGSLVAAVAGADAGNRRDSAHRMQPAAVERDRHDVGFVAELANMGVGRQEHHAPAV